MNTLDTALEWNSRGINTIPLQPNTKYYFSSTQLDDYLSSSRDVNQVMQDFAGKNVNLAVMPSFSPVARCYLVCLDFDDLETFNKWQQDKKVETLIERTKRGAHVFLWAIVEPGGLESEFCEIKYQSPVTASPSVVKGFKYKNNGKDIERVVSVENVVKCSPSKGKNQQITVNITHNSGIVNVGDFSFTRRSSSLIFDIKSYYPITAIFTNYSTNSNGMALAKCPMSAHVNGDVHPSLSLDLRSNRFRCFKPGCPLHLPRGGDVIDAYRIVNGLSLKEALREMAGELGF